MSLYPIIKSGMGALTPSLFKRLMDMLRSYESQKNTEKDPNEIAFSVVDLQNRIMELETEKHWFFAKLLRAHILDESLQNHNQYEYAFVKVRAKTGDPECCAACLETRGLGVDDAPLCCGINCNATQALQGHFQWEEDLSVSSWGSEAPEAWSTAGGDDPDDPLCRPCIQGENHPCNTEPYTNSAINLTEQFHTANNTFSTDESDGIGDFMMQAHGGGDTVQDEVVATICPTPNCTRYEFALNTTPIVIMWMTRESTGKLRYVFQAENGYDGTCTECTP